MLKGSSQNRQCSRLLPRTHGAHGHSRLPVWQAGTKSSVSLHLKIVNPSSRPAVLRWAGAPARDADGVAGRGCRKKRTPFCNGTDRGCNIALPRKRADFRLVTRDERADRTFLGGNSK
jgi:hypothetical protein